MWWWIQSNRVDHKHYASIFTSGFTYECRHNYSFWWMHWTYLLFAGLIFLCMQRMHRHELCMHLCVWFPVWAHAYFILMNACGCMFIRVDLMHLYMPCKYTKHDHEHLCICSRAWLIHLMNACMHKHVYTMDYKV
jgi:hypothetical protein